MKLFPLIKKGWHKCKICNKNIHYQTYCYRLGYCKQVKQLKEKSK